MSQSPEFQKALIDAMRGDATVSGLVDNQIWDSMPKSRPDPAIVLGASDLGTSRADGVRYWEETVQIDVFHRSKGLKHPTKRIVSAIVDLFDGTSHVIAEPFAIEKTEIEVARVFDAGDGISVRGIVQVTGYISRKL